MQYSDYEGKSPCRVRKVLEYDHILVESLGNEKKLSQPGQYCPYSFVPSSMEPA